MHSYGRDSDGQVRYVEVIRDLVPEKLRDRLKFGDGKDEGKGGAGRGPQFMDSKVRCCEESGQGGGRWRGAGRS